MILATVVLSFLLANTPRQEVKCLCDSAARIIKYDSIVQTTIPLLTYPINARTGAKATRSATEVTVYQLWADLVNISRDANGDYHLILRDRSSGARMSARVIAPLQVQRAFVQVRHRLRSTRTKLEQKIGAARSANTLREKCAVRVTGVAITEEIGSTSSVSNRVLHPVLDLVFLDQ